MNRNHSLLLLFFIVVSLCCYSQVEPFVSKATLERIFLEGRNDSLIINFRIKNRSTPHEWFYIDPMRIRLISSEHEVIKPSFGALSGSVGKWFMPNKRNQAIYYDLTADNIPLKGNYSAEFTAIPAYRKASESVAIYSLLLPGWGRYKLDTREKYPVIYSIVAGLLWTSALGTQILAYDNYEKYKQANSSEEAYSYFDKSVTYARASHGLYGAALAFNIYDFITVLRKGSKNRKQNELEGYK